MSALIATKVLHDFMLPNVFVFISVPYRNHCTAVKRLGKTTRGQHLFLLVMLLIQQPHLVASNGKLASIRLNGCLHLLQHVLLEGDFLKGSGEKSLFTSGATSRVVWMGTDHYLLLRP